MRDEINNEEKPRFIEITLTSPSFFVAKRRAKLYFEKAYNKETGVIKPFRCLCSQGLIEELLSIIEKETGKEAKNKDHLLGVASDMKFWGIENFGHSNDYCFVTFEKEDSAVEKYNSCLPIFFYTEESHDFYLTDFDL